MKGNKRKTKLPTHFTCTCIWTRFNAGCSYSVYINAPNWIRSRNSRTVVGRTHAHTHTHTHTHRVRFSL